MLINYANKDVNTDHPKVSIITPSYNQAQFIERTIQSVLNQDYPNIEYLIIDGGSTDGSVEIIRKYEHRLAYWISEPDRGQSHALNKGFQRATGDILAWINSDDEYTSGAISTVVQTFLKHQDLGLVYGNCDYIDEHGNVKEHFQSYQCDLKTLIKGNIIPQPGAFFKKKVLEDIGFVDQTLNYAMDYDLWLKIISRYNVKYLPLTLARFRQHTDSKTVSQYDFFWPEIFIVRDNILLNTPLETTFFDDVCSNMLWLIIYRQEGQVKEVAECFQCIDSKLFSYDDVQHLCAFFEGKAITSTDIKRVKNNLFLLYRSFYRRYVHAQKNNEFDKYAFHWIDQQLIFSAHHLFNQGKLAQSKRLFLMLLKNNSGLLKDCLTFRLILKYFLTDRGIKLIRKTRRVCKNSIKTYLC